MQPEPIEFTQLLARNLRKARAAAQLSQEDTRKRMNALGFTKWLGSTVSLVMRGKRRVTAEELIGLALALETTPGQLLTPEDDAGYQQIVMPSGFAFPGRRLFGLGQYVTWEDDEPVLVTKPDDLRKMLEHAVRNWPRDEGGE